MASSELERTFISKIIDGNHFFRGELGIHHIKTESTAGKMFWKEKQRVFYSFTPNKWAEKKKIGLKL